MNCSPHNNNLLNILFDTRAQGALSLHPPPPFQKAHGIFNKQNWAHILTLTAAGKNAKNVRHLTPLGSSSMRRVCTTASGLVVVYGCVDCYYCRSFNNCIPLFSADIEEPPTQRTTRRRLNKNIAHCTYGARQLFMLKINLLFT